jgi:glycosyltransferase involved in cell wall biosynthesis
MSDRQTNDTDEKPHLSMVMPCYNEEAGIGYTIPRLVNAFRNAGYRLELIAVDNGSADQTGQIIKDLELKNPEVVHLRVEVNEGYGNGVLNGIPQCNAPWIGIIPADGQVDAEDVVRLYEALVVTDGTVLVGQASISHGWFRKSCVVIITRLSGFYGGCSPLRIMAPEDPAL